VHISAVFCNHFNILCNDPAPSAHAIKTWIKNFEEIGSTLKKKIGSVKSVHMPENVALVEGVLQRSPTHSAHRYAVSLGISDRSVRRILHEDLPYHPCKIQIVHVLKDVNHEKLTCFLSTVIEHNKGDPRCCQQSYDE
jgi:hypothetical protein